MLFRSIESPGRADHPEGRLVVEGHVVAVVEVDLVPGGASEVTITSDAAPAREDVREAVDEAGYELTGTSA